MKSMLITALIIFSQFSFAQAQKKNVRLTSETATEAVEKSKIYERVDKMQKEGRSLTDDPKLAKHVADIIGARLTDIVNLDNTKLMNLININAKLTFSKIFELSSVVQDPNANAAEKAEATKALELLFLSGESVKVTVQSVDKETAKKEAAANKELLAKNVSLAEKVATFVNVKGAEKFVAEFIVQLEKGKSVSDAIVTAGKGKGKNGQDITEEQVRNCLKG